MTSRYSRTRRTFLLGSMAAVGAVAVGGGSRLARGAGSCSAPPFCLTLRAGGGWDPTLFCDPVVDERFTSWTEGDLRTVEGIQYAPYDVDGGTATPYAAAGGDDFFRKHGKRMVVLNGLDHETVAHDVGPRMSMSGTTREGMPSISGLVAGLAGRGLPLPYLAEGGYASAQGLVPHIRIAGGKTLRQILNPNLLGSSLRDAAMPPGVHDVVEQARWARDQRLMSALPSEQGTVGAFRTARNAEIRERFGDLEAALDALATDSDNDGVQTASAVMAAFKAGVSAAAHITYNGNGSQFDTHDGDHGSLNARDGHRPALQQLFEIIDYVVDATLRESAIAERGLVLVVGSEFGRTALNESRGKDHWNIGSMIVLGVGAAESMIEGGRSVGRTSTTLPGGEPSNGLYSRKAKLVAGALDYTDDEKDPDAFRLTPRHVHVALRDALGLCDDHLIDKPLTQFRVPDVDRTPLPLFRS